jgi:NAD(P)-dependent dehydrogenase (short-subunit alcohol dehydrogenase family)
MSLKQLFNDARNPPANPTHLSFKDKAVLVTGANTGLGYQAALKYAALGASPLILGVRSREKGEAAKASITRETKCAPGSILVMTVDLSIFASVKEFVDRLNEQVPRLHVALLCAGVAKPTFVTSPEGHEISTQVNVLSTALMALLLLPKLRETAAAGGDLPHLCFVNSQSSHLVKPDQVPVGQTLIQRLDDGSQYDSTTQYFLVKLAAWFAMRGVVERLRQQDGDGATANNVVINSCCPGMCRTDQGRDFPLGQRVFMGGFQAIFARSAEQGSRTLVSATGLGLESTGKFWVNDEYYE